MTPTAHVYLQLAALALLFALLVRQRRLRRGWVRRTKLGPSRMGTVYVFQDRAQPELVKVGTTRRLSKLRKAEVSRNMAGGSPLVQVYAIDMPFAAAVEKEAHRLLRARRATWAPGSCRGREWFVLPQPGALHAITGALEQAAQNVRGAALNQRRWTLAMDRRARKSWRQGSRYVREQLFSGSEEAAV